MARNYYKHPELKGLSKEEKDKVYCSEYRKRHLNRNLHRAAKARSKKRGYEFELGYDDIVIPEFCPILGIPLQSGIKSGSGGNMNSPSLDRIDNTKGYIKGNVQVISHKANSMKFTATPEELIRFAKWVLNTYEGKL